MNKIKVHKHLKKQWKFSGSTGNLLTQALEAEPKGLCLPTDPTHTSV